MKNNKKVNLKTATSGNDAVNFTQLNNDLSNYLHLTGGTLKGDIQCNNNCIYGIKNVSNDTSAVNRKYVKDERKKKLDKNKDINMGGNKIISYRNPNDLNELVDKSYVDQNVSKYLPIDLSLAMREELSLGSSPLTDLPEPKYRNDATTKKYVDNALNSKINKTL